MINIIKKFDCNKAKNNLTNTGLDLSTIDCKDTKLTLNHGTFERIAQFDYINYSHYLFMLIYLFYQIVSLV